MVRLFVRKSVDILFKEREFTNKCISYQISVLQLNIYQYRTHNLTLRCSHGRFPAKITFANNFFIIGNHFTPTQA